MTIAQARPQSHAFLVAAVSGNVHALHADPDV